MKFHEAANIFPMMPEAELKDLADDIKVNGLLEPIITWQGKILDGRNRYKACKLAGKPPRFDEWKNGGDPVAFVISKNLKRRHLNESQRAMVGARVANMRQGERTDIEPSANLQKVSQSSSAEMLNISPRSVASAKTVIDDGIPELAQAVDAGILAVSEAAKLATQEPEYQAAIVAKINDGIKPQEAKRQMLAESYAAAPELPKEERKYRVIYADPPWSYGNTQIDGFKEQRDHYPVMKLDEICALPIKDITEDNAVLFLWVTSPILEDSFKVIKAWGFKYKASFIWDKVKHVMGHYNSVRHELLLVSVRGSCQPDNRKLFDSVVTEERTEHSCKPDIFREMIDQLYVNGNRIELFSRKWHEGWDAYGNETSKLA